MRNTTKSNLVVHGLDLEKLATVIGCASSHVEDIETGIEDGSHFKSENENLPALQAAVDELKLWHRRVSLEMQMDNETLTAIKLDELITKIVESLPAEGGYEKGYRDALESIAHALAPVVSAPVLLDTLGTALDAYGNNVDDVELLLSHRDDDGIVVDHSTEIISIENLSNIVDRASELVLMRRDGRELDKGFEDLTEALSESSVIESDEAFQYNAKAAQRE